MYDVDLDSIFREADRYVRRAYFQSYAIWIIAYIIDGIIFGCISNHIAKSKGYDSGFAWGFWLGIIGVIVVACKSDNHSYYAASSNSSSDSFINLTWTCKCGHTNPISLDYCTFCRRGRYEHENSVRTVCPHCGHANDASHQTFCAECGKDMTKPPVVPEPEPAAEVEPKEPKHETVSEAKQDNISTLKALAQLYKEGILTEEEYSEKKKEILSRM